MEDVKEQVSLLMTEDTREDIKENGEDDHNKGREEKLDAAIGFQQNDPSNVASCSPLHAKIRQLLKPPEGGLKCDECECARPLVALCADCEHYLCKVCYEYHTKSSTKTKSHYVLPLDEARLSAEARGQSEYTVAVGVSYKPYCPKHPTQNPNHILEYYCETCNELVCLYCVMTKGLHWGHEHDIVDKVAHRHREQLKKIISPVDEMSEKLSRAEKDINNSKEKIIGQYKRGLTSAKMKRSQELKSTTISSQSNCKVHHH